MEEVELYEAIELFFGNNKLSELCEVLKTGDDILDVISLSENQHSDLLAWMFDPREGHGQGDQILRDLLLAAVQATVQECGLDRRGTTARFFAEWTPSKIRTSNFGSAFIARELGMRASERVDLFVIDPTNKFVLLIENKAGATHNSVQLDGYRKSWREAVASNPHLQEYSSVFIALDREFVGDDWSDRPSSNYWLHLGYDWLKASATRALLHVERGNDAARLVVSYCSRQTNWESPASKRAITLAAELHEAHSPAIKYLLEASTGRLEKSWIESRLDTYMMFMLQNKAAISLLRDTQGMASIKETLAAKISGLKRENIAHARAWLDICPPGWEKHVGEHWWPVYFSISYSDSSRAKCDIALILDKGYANSEEEGEELRSRLKSFNTDFEKHQSTDRRRVVLNKNLGISDLVRKLDEHFTRLLKCAE